MTDQKNVFGLQFSSLGLETVADMLVNRPPDESSACMLFTVNLDNVIHLRKDEAFRAAHQRAKIITADGAPVFLYARLRGVALKERVSGADLLPELLKRVLPERHRLFFVVSDDETKIRLKENLEERGFCNHTLTITVPSFGFEKDIVYSNALADQIRKMGTTHLVMGVGAPKSQIWIDQHRNELGRCYALPLGSAPNFLVGTASRAPRWMRAFGFEWLWRVICEPRRLFRRYFIDSWLFLAAIRDDLLPKRPG